MIRCLGLLLALLALPVQADIYKCRLPNGRTEISNAPCPSGSGTLTVRPDDTVSEANRQQAERDVERMRSFVEKREAEQRNEEAAERQRQSSERQSAAQQRVYQSGTMDDCLRELDLYPVEPARRAELEAICRAKARSEPTLVPVPVFGGIGNPVDACIHNVMRLQLGPSEHNRRIALCQGQVVVPHVPHQPSGPPPTAKPPGKPCPRNDKFCVR